MTTISLKLPKTLLRQLEEAAAARNVTKSAIIRESLERTLRQGPKSPGKLSCLDLMGKSVGSFKGPRDLSTNRTYLSDALSSHARRCR